MRLLVSMLLIGCTCLGEPPYKDSCTPATTQLTHWGHNHLVVDLQAKPVKTLRGTVRAPNKQPVDGVLVEVYVRHEKDPLPHQIDEIAEGEHRICACITGTKGEFAFDLRPGRYEVRSSKPDWNSTSVLVVVDSRKGKKTVITIPFNIGD